jgi:hypothetical protein
VLGQIATWRAIGIGRAVAVNLSVRQMELA